MKNITEECLCRGKRVDNGEWVEGYLVCRKYVCRIVNFDLSLNVEGFKVIPETVGRYTGIHDSTTWEELSEMERESFFAEIKDETRITNISDAEQYWKGKRIFEDDIVLTQEHYDRPYSDKRKAKRHKGLVKYKIRGGNGFYNKKTKEHNLYREYCAEWVVDVKDYGKFVHGSWGDFFDCRVIGNIHDTPDLLEEGA